MKYTAKTNKDKLSKSELLDLKRYYVPSGDVGFSPARNQAIIDRTIKKNEEMRIKKMKAYREKVGERAEAVTSYLLSRKGAQGGNSVERYFGRQTLAHLRGQSIIEEMAYLEGQAIKRLKEIR